SEVRDRRRRRIDRQPVLGRLGPATRLDVPPLEPLERRDPFRAELLGQWPEPGRFLEPSLTLAERAEGSQGLALARERRGKTGRRLASERTQETLPRGGNRGQVRLELPPRKRLGARQARSPFERRDLLAAAPALGS